MKSIYIKTLLAILIVATGCSVELTKTPDQLNSARTMTYRSEVLDIDSFFLVMMPADVKEPLPVLYILQGAGADPWGWMQGTELQEACDDYEMMIVSIGAGGEEPWDTPYRGKYIDYVVEITEIVDQTFNTIPDNKHRAIAGISLGGFGALEIASNRKDIFISASSMSGGFYVNEDSSNYVNLDGLHLFFDCGQVDSLLYDNYILHTKLDDQKIPHLFMAPSSGDHNWDYWSSQALEHFYFHSQFFKGEKIVDYNQ